MMSDTGKNFQTIKTLFDYVEATNDKGALLSLDEAFENSIEIIINQDTGKLLFIGNGASASIASHMATDFWKNTGIRAMAFNDSALLTCISNDYGYKHVFEKPIQMFSDSNDVLIPISSSGQSENILFGVSAAKAKGLKIISLSGFNADNPLRKSGDINFYVSSNCYGHVEVLHHAICHCILDEIICIKSEQGIQDGGSQVESLKNLPEKIAAFSSEYDEADLPKHAQSPK